VARGESYRKGIIKELTFRDGCIAVSVLVKVENKTKKRYVSPITIMALQMAWLENGFVSDEEEEDENFHFQSLPPFRLTNDFDFYDEGRTKAIRWIQLQVDGIQTITMN
jgi:hypothetical protein